MKMSIEQVGILGCGLMGGGIAQVCAQAGLKTMVKEIDQKFIDKGFGVINKNLQRAADKGKITGEKKDEIMSNLKGTLEFEDLKDCDLIIEAVPELLDVKNGMYSTLAGICPEKTIFASNTSSLTVVAMAAATGRTDRFCGMHFFNPVPMMRLVEVVKTIATSQETIDNCFEFCRNIGKSPILAKDRSGFIVNRLLIPYMLDAMTVLEEGLASTEDIDKGIMLGLNHPMGPLTLADFVGLDTFIEVCEIMFEEFHEKRFAAPPLLKKMVLAGYYGRKSGKGFYDYSGEKPVPTDLGI